MAGLKLMAHGGYVPRVAPHLLQDTEAQQAINTKLYAGDLRAWKKPLPLTSRVTVPTNTKTIFRGKTVAGDDRWLAWGADVDVVKSPVPDSTQGMSLYYTGDGTPKKTNSTLAGTTNGTTPAAWQNMGVAAPTAAPTVTRNGSGGTPETRVYVYTYVNLFGSIEQESGPSPVSAQVICGSGDTVTVSGFSAAPTSGYNITKIRIYRSVSGSSTTSFFLVAEIPVSQTTYTDSILSAGLGESLQSLTWVEPPTGLKGLVSLPNGFMAGFVGNQIYFSEVLYPHAWPLAYTVSLDTEIVGLSVFGQSLAVLTKGYPYIVSGVSPEAMTAEKIPVLEPCLAKRSIVSDATGVMYASPNGICMVAPGNSGLQTGNVMLRDDFQKFNPTTLRSALFAGKYFGFYVGGTETITDGAFILDRNISATPLSLSTITSDACFVDMETANMYIVYGGEIQAWDSDTQNTMPFEWLSKRFIFTAPTNLAALEVDADFDNLKEGAALTARAAQIKASNQALFASSANLNSTLNTQLLDQREVNGSILQTIPATVDNRYLLIELRCDDRVLFTGQYNKRGVYRLPSGFKGQAFEVRITGNIELRYVKMAETMKELKAL